MTTIIKNFKFNFSRVKFSGTQNIKTTYTTDTYLKMRAS